MHEMETRVTVLGAGGSLQDVPLCECAKLQKDPLHHDNFIAAENFCVDDLSSVNVSRRAKFYV